MALMPGLPVHLCTCIAARLADFAQLVPVSPILSLARSSVACCACPHDMVGACKVMLCSSLLHSYRCNGLLTAQM